jgi:predicted dinucleotide-binding enzyme
MPIGILGTGTVGQALAAKLAELDHEVLVGIRHPVATLAREEAGGYGSPPFRIWYEQHPEVKLGSFADAAAHGELVVNATDGGASLDALRLASEASLAGKVLVDIANALDVSRGMPLAAGGQHRLPWRAHPADLPLGPGGQGPQHHERPADGEPRQLAHGDHTVFVCGNDPEAKALVTGLLTEGFGWRDVIDLGDLTAARGAEMLVALWVRLWGVLQTPPSTSRWSADPARRLEGHGVTVNCGIPGGRRRRR